jgi:transposase
MRACPSWLASCSRPKLNVRLQAQISEAGAKFMAWHKADVCSRRLADIPGIGPADASLLLMKTAAPEMFRSGRQFAAGRGLAEGSFTGRQGQARRHHKGRRRSLAPRFRGWGGRRHPTWTTRRARAAVDRRPP